MEGDLPTTAISHWYYGERPKDFENAEVAFENARMLFELQGTRDPRKKDRLQTLKTTTMDDLLNAVKDAQEGYHQRRTESALGRCMDRLAERIHYYGNIMDVLVQHHPEFTSLAWGAMKLLVGAIVEHKSTGLTIANGLLDIADALSRAKLATSLFPTSSIKRMFAILYAHIIRFLLRGLEWYEEGSWKRAIHAVTKPAALRYDDIINDIHRTTDKITAYSSAGSQAEQRDIHLKFLAAQRMIEENASSSTAGQARILQQLEDLHDLVTATRAEQAEISRSVFSIQSIQALHVIYSQCSIDHQSCLQMSIGLRNHRRFRQRTKTTPFWKAPRLQSWNQSATSSLLPIKVRIADRKLAQDFCTNIVEQLLSNKIANLWVLTPQRDCHPVIATLKSLIYQTVTFIDEMGAKSNILQYLDRFNHASLDEHFLDVLAGLLRSLRVVFMIVQLEAIDPHYAEDFLSCLHRLIRKLSDSGSATVLRILLLSWSPKNFLSEEGQTQPLKLYMGARSRRRGHFMPSRPLYVPREAREEVET
ncbi:uncharacterized protein N7477_000225 [Penicillium maclennaniae]|uniref:uncharacterized protein n=1 Tax=Penicillium maclennaniae TaxID=1343394 RepID=UPI002541B92B|nr:uncharacterized protein N7477_000225 [Penicillium maclennaniae]KAJ5683880.1 hypothetical protein N7477_000225 [Penicillium maclennaniae]